MSWQAVEAVIAHSKMHGAPYAVQLVIAEAIIQGCTETNAQQSFLAERSHLSLGEFRRQCQSLVTKGELCCKRHGRRPNTYSFPWYTIADIRLNPGEQDGYSPEPRRIENDGYSPEPRRTQTAWVQANKSAVPYSGNPDPGDISARARAREELPPGVREHIPTHGYGVELDMRRWAASQCGLLYLRHIGLDPQTRHLAQLRHAYRQFVDEVLTEFQTMAEEQAQ